MAGIYRGIEAADSFLYIISPDSVTPEICTLEIQHVVKHNKRLTPVVRNEVEDNQVHSAITDHNGVFLRPEDNFELLIDALNTDLDHVRELLAC